MTVITLFTTKDARYEYMRLLTIPRGRQTQARHCNTTAYIPTYSSALHTLKLLWLLCWLGLLVEKLKAKRRGDLLWYTKWKS
jgi:hypothetical protein